MKTDLKKLEKFFSAKNVAIIGASRRIGSFGRIVAQNFLNPKFKGKLFLINPKADKILGQKCYKNLNQIKQKIDLVIIVVPAPIAIKVFEECGKKKISNVVMITAGFDELGNTDLSKKLKKSVNKYKKTTRLIGPNCLGVLNPENQIDTLFLPTNRLKRPEKGNVSFISQSGAMGTAVLDWALREEYGIAKFVSYGNAYDVDETDLIEYLAEDKKTDVIGVYLEGVKNGRKFFEVAKRVSKKKPIIILKGGTSKAGKKAVLSHTASLAGSSQVYEALFSQMPLIEAKNLVEFFNYCKIFAKSPRPKGNNVLIMSEGGGFAVLATDSAEKYGLQLAQMGKEHLKKIQKVIPKYVKAKNPLDLTGDVTNDMYCSAIKEGLLDKNVDMIVVLLLYQVPALNSQAVETLMELNEKKKKPIVAVTIGGKYSEMHKRAMEKEGIVTFLYPHNAMQALRKLFDYYNFD